MEDKSIWVDDFISHIFSSDWIEIFFVDNKVTSCVDEIFKGLIEIIFRNFSSVFEILISPSIFKPWDSLPFIVDNTFN